MSDKYDKIVEVAMRTICTEVSRIEKERFTRAHNLKKLRDKRGYSQSKLAELSGVNIRMIQYYEQGARDIGTAQADTLYKLAQALECSMEELLEGELAESVNNNLCGEWISIGDWLLECSSCGNVVNDDDTGEFYKYCPHCGKRMGGVERDT